MIKVLYLEDEIEKMDAFFDTTYLAGIELVHKDTANKFCDELIKKYIEYDAVILDVNGIVDSFDEKPSSASFKQAYDTVSNLKNKKIIPFFVLSAQISKDGYQSLKDFIGDENIYIKSNDEIKLIENIKETVAKSTDYTIKQRYKRVFEITQEKYIGNRIYERLMKLINQVEYSDDLELTNDNLLPIRKIIEYSCERLLDLELIPHDIYKQSFNSRVKFLCNNKSKSKYSGKNMHKTMAFFIDNLLSMVQDNQHDIKSLELEVDDYIVGIRTPYLFKSLVYQLMDFLLWVKQLIDENPNPEINKKLWTNITSTYSRGDWIYGKVFKIENEYGTFKPDDNGKTLSIIPKKVRDLNLKQWDKVRVTTKPDESGTKTYIDIIEKV